MSESKRVTREGLARALADDNPDGIVETTAGPVSVLDYPDEWFDTPRQIANDIFDALPADPPASADADAAWVHQVAYDVLPRDADDDLYALADRISEAVAVAIRAESAQCKGYAGDPGASAPRCESYRGHPGRHFIRPIRAESEATVAALREATTVMGHHRLCGPKYEGCYAHYPFMQHCRADGMQWPCDVDLIRRAALAATPEAER